MIPVPERITIRLNAGEREAIQFLEERFHLRTSTVSKIVRKALRDYHTSLMLEEQRHAPPRGSDKPARSRKNVRQKTSVAK